MSTCMVYDLAGDDPIREFLYRCATRPGLDTDEVADVVWSMNSAEYFMLLVRERGWPPERFAAWLADAWCHLFLA